ncbi:MAG: STAS domain-containing protein [Sedimentisphaerales bacterium]|nr:STAS domain-containing protein [Sedimentisphaerales bacterium]
MVISHEIRDDVVVVKIELAELRAATTTRFKRSVIEVLERCGSVRVVLDMSGMSFIDSSGLGAFLSVLRYITTKGGDLKLACLGDEAEKVVKRVQLHKVIEVCKTVDEAVAAFAEGQEDN